MSFFSVNLNDIVPNMPQVNVSTMDGNSGYVVYDDTPDECPICLRGTNPRAAGGIIIGVLNQVGTQLRIAFQCTWNNCMETFLGYYTLPNSSQGYKLLKVAPKNPAKAQFPDTITEVSSDFIKIYNQAMAAESVQLDQVVGIGLRKALEFLIKDFCINQHPTKSAEIKKVNLGSCIKTYCDDIRLKTAASRAVWLANDETHYTRIWVDRDITDLKTLISLSVNWIDSVVLTQQYEKGMDPTNPP